MALNTQNVLRFRTEETCGTPSSTISGQKVDLVGESVTEKEDEEKLCPWNMIYLCERSKIQFNSKATDTKNKNK